MRTKTTNINNKDVVVLVAGEGMTIIRKHDNVDMGNSVYLGIDYSTGTPREDKIEYYAEVPIDDQTHII